MLSAEQFSSLSNSISGLKPFLYRFRSLTTSTTGELINVGSTRLYRLNIVNTAASIIYVKLYDKATIPLSTDTPICTFAVASGVGINVVHNFVAPDIFSAGLGVRCVTGSADNDVASPATSPILEVRFN
jgi:hypothetical protein